MNTTMPYLTPDDLERRAHKRAAAKLGWAIHALVYVVVGPSRELPSLARRA